MTILRFFSKTAWLLILPLFFMVSCKKDEIPEPSLVSPILEMDKSTLLNELADSKVINFFDLDYIETTNANIVPVLGTPSTVLPEAIEDVYMDFLIKNGELDYVKDILPEVGYPLWKRAGAYSTSGFVDQVVIIPFSSLNGENTHSMIIAIPDNNDPFYPYHDNERSGYFYITTTRAEMETLLSDPGSIIEDTYTKLPFFIQFDESIFDFRDEEWIQIWEDYDDGFQGGIIQNRGCTVTLCPPIVFQGEIDDRGCNGTLDVDIDCGGGSIYIGGDGEITYTNHNNTGSNIPGSWEPGGGTDPLGTGNHGNTGTTITGQSPEEAAVAEIIRDCSEALSPDVHHEAGEGGVAATEDGMAVCEMLMEAMNNISLPFEQWIYLYNHNHRLLGLAGEIASSEGPVFSFYIDQIESENTTLEYRPFSRRVGIALQLAGSLNLSEDELSWLIDDILTAESIEESVADQVRDFIEENSYEEDAIAVMQSSKLVINLATQDKLMGPYDDDYFAIVENSILAIDLAENPWLANVSNLGEFSHNQFTIQVCFLKLEGCCPGIPYGLA